MPEALFDPLAYSPLWLIGGCVLVLAVAFWFGYVWWSTRAPVTNVPAQALHGNRLAELQARYLRDIEAVANEHRAGRLSDRAAFQRLSPLVRRFAFEAAGFPAHTMSLADLERRHPGVLPRTIAEFYPGEFAEMPDGDIASGAQRAAQVVASWR